MNSSLPVLSVNLLPPDKLYCNFSYWSSLFSQDMQILWDRAHGVPLEKLPKGVSDMIFPYLLLALSDYKTSQINKMNGIGLDNLLSLSLIHISEPTRLLSISYAVFCLKKKKK